MLSGFEKKVADFIKTNKLIDSGERILLAVSGGADSIALLYVLRALIDQNRLDAGLFCAHINHQLRGSEADLDENFVIQQTAELNIPITTKRVDVRAFANKNRLSIETAARQLRIESLLEIASGNNCNLIATGHQKNDNAETVLQRLLRGTGYRGLGGIWPVRSFQTKAKFIRPLLCVTRDEITRYLQSLGLKWRHDRTNIDEKYRRNFIRHRLLPILQQDCQKTLVEQLSKLAALSYRLYNMLYEYSERAWQRLADFRPGEVSLNLKGLLSEPKLIQIELVRRGLTTAGCGERNITQSHYERTLQITEKDCQTSKIIMPGKVTVWREQNKLIFTQAAKRLQSQKKTAGDVILKIPGLTEFCSYSIETTILRDSSSELEDFKARKNSYTEWFDLDKINQPLIARFRQAGDRFWPLGLKAQKKLGKFLTAAKVPQQVRDKLFVVTNGDKIIWICPVRISEQAKVTNKTREILQLQVTETRPH